MGAELARLAAAIASPTRAGVLDELMDDVALSVTVLAGRVGVARPTAAEAVSTLEAAGLVATERRGRERRVRLAGPEVARALEALSVLTSPAAPHGLREHNRMRALRAARTCYDHIAGALGVRLATVLTQAGVLDAETWSLTEAGVTRLEAGGVRAAGLAGGSRRPAVRRCRDWTERDDHVAGGLGALICSTWLEHGLVRRQPGGRALLVTSECEAWLTALGG